MNRKILLGMALLITMPFANADSVQLACKLKNPNQVQMIECASEKYDHYDHQLNLLYQTKIKKLQKSKANQLRSSQRVWVNKKETDCNHYSEEDNGSNGPLEAFECSTQMTKERIEFIKKYK